MAAKSPGRAATGPVSIAPVGEGFGIFLADRPLRTPAGAAIVVPTEILAQAIAAEWRGAGPRPRPNQLLLTRLTCTALDRVGPHRTDIEAQLLAYAETDLVCHRAAEPPDLVAAQQGCWQPLLDWLARRHDAILSVTTGIIARKQDAAALRALRAALGGLDVWRLTALSAAVAACGSLVIGLALLDRRVDAAGAFAAAEIDASWQMEKWGEDYEATLRREEVRADLDLAAKFLTLLD